MPQQYQVELKPKVAKDIKLLFKAEHTKEFAVLPYQEFLEIQQILEDLQELREAKAKEFHAPTSPLSQVLAQVSQS